MRSQLEDKDDKDQKRVNELVEKLEKGKYDKNLIEEDASIRDGQIQVTKLWSKLQKYVMNLSAD